MIKERDTHLLNSFNFFKIILSLGTNLCASCSVLNAAARSPRENKEQAPRNNNFACTSVGTEYVWIKSREKR